jgi:predicted dinucleotide-binding enzyme
VSELATAMGFQPVDVGGIKNARPLESMSILYMVPYLTGKRDAAFEWAVRGTGNKATGKVRPAE